MGRRMAINLDIRERDAAQRERQPARQGRGFHAWQGAHALHELPVELAPAALRASSVRVCVTDSPFGGTGRVSQKPEAGSRQSLIHRAVSAAINGHVMVP